MSLLIHIFGRPKPYQPSWMERTFKISVPHEPGFRFEWHPAHKRLYLIRVGVLTSDGKEVGEPIAFDVENEGSAWNYALVFLRGYRARTQPHLGRIQAAQVN